MMVTHSIYFETPWIQGPNTFTTRLSQHTVNLLAAPCCFWRADSLVYSLTSQF